MNKLIAAVIAVLVTGSAFAETQAPAWDKTSCEINLNACADQVCKDKVLAEHPECKS